MTIWRTLSTIALNTINYNTLKLVLFDSFSNETFLQWFYENEKMIELRHKEFYESILADWEFSILPNLNSIRDLIKYKLIGQSVYEIWEIEFYLTKIHKDESSVLYCRRLYSEYYEDKSNSFLNSICDLIVLYCYDNEGLGLPGLDFMKRKKVNTEKVYPKIIEECKTLLAVIQNYPENKENPFWRLQKNYDVKKNDFEKILNWYKSELKEVDNIN